MTMKSQKSPLDKEMKFLKLSKQDRSFDLESSDKLLQRKQRRVKDLAVIRQSNSSASRFLSNGDMIDFCRDDRRNPPIIDLATAVGLELDR